MARESTASEPKTITITGRSEGPKRTAIETAKTEVVIGDASPSNTSWDRSPPASTSSGTSSPSSGGRPRSSSRTSSAA